MPRPRRASNPSQLSIPMGGDKKSATINDSGLGAGARPCWRRWRDLNSRYGFAVLPHFECGPFSHLGTSPCVNYTIIQVITKKSSPLCKFKHKELVHHLLLSTPLHLLNICKRFRSVTYHCVGTTLGKQLHKPMAVSLPLAYTLKRSIFFLCFVQTIISLV